MLRWAYPTCSDFVWYGSRRDVGKGNAEDNLVTAIKSGRFDLGKDAINPDRVCCRLQRFD
jgi:hypothetical protein